MKFDVGDIVAWEHSDTAAPFIGLITSLNKKKKEVTSSVLALRKKAI